MNNTDTIIAQATAPGRGGVGIIRVSGPLAKDVAKKILNQVPTPRQAVYQSFNDQNQHKVDQGIALFFESPNSFTGEDVLELHGHGGPIVMEMLIDSCLSVPTTRLAKPGEFSEQAFLNNKIDLAQAEAIADLIEASSRQAAKSALNSLQGEFSNLINEIVEDVIHLRMYVEAAIDFPEEEIDFLSDGKVKSGLASIIQNLEQIKTKAKQGSLLRDGMSVVIVGRPNAGKSSLLNALAGKNTAIVTDIAGTTRDVLKEYIHIDGMPLHIIDTAGIRNSNDKIEQIGIARAWGEINKADRILFMIDSTTEDKKDPKIIWPELFEKMPNKNNISIIRNKSDQTGEKVGENTSSIYPTFCLSAKTHEGIDILKSHLKRCMGYEQSGEDQIIARKRHITSLSSAEKHIKIGQKQLQEHLAGELLAEELRIAQQHLNEITGEFSSDDLLGKIFSSFCIGK